MIVVAAGGIMNILLAVLLMMVICGQEDRYATMRIAGFAENSAFEAAGVEVGDVITSIGRLHRPHRAGSFLCFKYGGA